AFHEAAGLAEEGVDLAFAGQFLAVVLGKFGLVIEGVGVTDAAGAEDLYDALGLGREVRPPAACGFALSAARLAVEQPGEGDGAEAAAGLPEEVAPRECGLVSHDPCPIHLRYRNSLALSNTQHRLSVPCSRTCAAARSFSASVGARPSAMRYA